MLSAFSKLISKINVHCCVQIKLSLAADVIDLTKDKDEDLEKAIALSLQEAQVFTHLNA